jgi:tRNA pseudouridine55 synthase
LARRRKGRPVHGWIILDKPLGMTSTRAVGTVRRLLEAQKAGHAGTLDPLATGILPIALGEATKTVAHIVDARKIYRFAVAWGKERATDDAEGEVVATSAARPERGAIEALLPQFMGVIRQKPPAFSAIKVEGERAYDLARDGEIVDLPEREVEIFDLRLLKEHEEASPDLSWFEVECGKGTYVRAIARDMGRLLGCFGHVAALRRLCVGPFDEARAFSMDKLMEFIHSAPADRYLLPVETALDDIPALAVTGPEAERLAWGQEIRVPFQREGLVRVMAEDRFVAIADLAAGVLRPVRVFNS